MRYARTIGVGLALVVLVALPVQAQDDDPITAIRELLDRRVAAIAAGDLEAFLATVDPAAPEEFRASQTQHFNGLRSVPLEGYALGVDDAETGDLSPPGLGDVLYQGARTFIPETTQRYRLGGYDDRDAVDSLWLTFVERDGEWFVGGDRDLEVVGLLTGRTIWDLGPVRLLPTEHFLVISHPDRASRADDLARLAEEAFARHARLWDRPWSERLPVILPSSVDELEVIIQSTFDLDNFVAFVGYDVDYDAPSGYETTAPRMYIQDRNLAEYDEAFQVETLVHELVHAATAADAGPFVDRWVHEGVADWVATGRLSGLQPPDGSDGRIPDPFEFSTGGSRNINESYGESRSAISFLADLAGPAAPADLLTTLGATRVAPGSVDHQVGRALEATAGTPDFAAFEKAWAGR